MNSKRVWYSNEINPESPDSIHQTLMFGTLEEIRMLLKSVGGKRVKNRFLRYPKKIYTAPAFNFIKNFILGINTRLDEQKYLKNTPRHLG